MVRLQVNRGAISLKGAECGIIIEQLGNEGGKDEEKCKLYFIVSCQHQCVFADYSL